jgi:ABC-type transport system involved in multi-copper enzyme maturation permease subunit
LLTASAVSQEKDRKTLLLLLLTNLTNSELVLGKLLASVLTVIVMLTAALPLFMLSALLGGISFEQIARVFAVSLAAALFSGSLGSTIALWREKTFQALALTALVLVFWLAWWELVAAGSLGSSWAGIATADWAVAFSPWQAILAAARPAAGSAETWARIGGPVIADVATALALALGLNLFAILRVRVWNPSREVMRRTEREESPTEASIWGAEHDAVNRAELATPALASPDLPILHEATVATSTNERLIPGHLARSADAQGRSVHAAPGKTRQVWDNPILWREVCTWAYGRKVLVVRIGYWLLFAAAAVLLHNIVTADTYLRADARTLIPLAARPLILLFILSLVLLNALAVTSITNERDVKALDLLLVTDLSPKEILFGKLGGVFYNSKEMILLPILLCGYLWWQGGVSAENLFYLAVGLLVVNAFGAMLGIHVGMSYGNARSAIGVSVGTVLFLLIGIAVCMRMMVAFSNFHGQFQPFMAFMLGGGIGLYISLGLRNPSTAIGIASFGAPFATFYAITSYLLGGSLAVFLVVCITYGFATAAMLVPALFEFDVATGRAASDDE